MCTTQKVKLREHCSKQQPGRCRRQQQGSIAVEFVILLPFLLVILFGIIDVSLMLYDKMAITNAARAAARAGTCVSVPPLTADQITAVAMTALNGSLFGGGGSTTKATVIVSQTNGTTTGNPLAVTVSYPYHGLFIGSALTALTGTISLSATAVMNYE